MPVQQLQLIFVMQQFIEQQPVKFIEQLQPVFQLVIVFKSVKLFVFKLILSQQQFKQLFKFLELPVIEFIVQQLLVFKQFVLEPEQQQLQLLFELIVFKFKVFVVFIQQLQQLQLFFWLDGPVLR